jgi:hypothetical protein
MKWAFILFTLYSGPFGAFLYVLGCREPLPGLHERYTSVRWRQALGSTMHCVAGDGIGILAGAVVALLDDRRRHPRIRSRLHLRLDDFSSVVHARPLWLRLRQVVARHLSSGISVHEPPHGRHVAGGRDRLAHTPCAHEPTKPLFRLSLALMTGALVAFPINWWMVAHHLKHGMMTVRPETDGAHGGMKMDMGEGGADHAPSPPVWVMTLLSLLVLAIGATVAFTFGGAH